MLQHFNKIQIKFFVIKNRFNKYLTICWFSSFRFYTLHYYQRMRVYIFIFFSCRLLYKAIKGIMIARAFPTLIYWTTLCQSENKTATQVYTELKIYNILSLPFPSTSHEVTNNFIADTNRTHSNCNWPHQSIVNWF